MAERREDNPRVAALAHAYTAAVGYGMQPDSPVWQADGIQAVAEGLVYVGDRLEDIRREIWNANNAKGIYRERASDPLAPDPESVYKQALERIANHEEHPLSGPPDDEMREIAIGALAAGER